MRNNGPSEETQEPGKTVSSLFRILSPAAGLIRWFVPYPAGVTPQAWHLAAIFLAALERRSLTALYPVEP